MITRSATMNNSNDQVDPQSTTTTNTTNIRLSPEQINTFITDGILVVDNVLSSTEITAVLQELHHTTLRTKYNVDITQLLSSSSSSLQAQQCHPTTTTTTSDTASTTSASPNNVNIDTTYNNSNNLQNFVQLSSTNGSGGVLDIYYEPWQIQYFATNETLFHITSELWKYTYGTYNNKHHIDDSDRTTKENNNEQSLPLDRQPKQVDDVSLSSLWYHPYGNFDCTKGYMYLDRIGYRLPTTISFELGERMLQQRKQQSEQEDVGRKMLQDQSTITVNSATTTKKSKKKKLSIQRSLTPHFDCCPNDMYPNNATKWRPIQCFVSLTDTIDPNHGGFEGVPKFHTEFYNYYYNINNNTSNNNNNNDNEKNTNNNNITCIGEYTHVRPKEDSTIYERIRHIPVKAGSAIFWDQRIPHANSYRHDGTTPRIVVYCSFLPDVPINRIYIQNQLKLWKRNEYPNGNQWIQNTTTSNNNNNNHSTNNDIHESDDNNDNHDGNETYTTNCDVIHKLLSTPFARRLAGVDKWE